MSEICGRNERHCIACIFYLDHSDILRCFHIVLDYQCLCSFRNYIRYKFMSVHNCTFDTDEQGILDHFAGIILYSTDFLLHAALAAGIFQSL